MVKHLEQLMFKDFEDFILKGFDVNNYPHFNIVKTSDTEYVLELAVAGFTKDNIKVYIDNRNLIIEGSRDVSNITYLHKGISTKNFKRVFGITDGFKVGTISMNNGLLTVLLVKVESPNTIKLLSIE